MLHGWYGKVKTDNNFIGKKVLITGHTGFKGTWLCLLLRQLGAKIHGYSLKPETNPNHYGCAQIRRVLETEKIGDIRDINSLQEYMTEVKPDYIFHLAAQPLVQLSYKKPVETYEVNVLGSINVLECLRRTNQHSSVIMVTSDKCYQNSGQIWGYRECDPLGGSDPYSSSKASAEIAINSYRESFFPPAMIRKHGVKIASVRAGNVIGGGDWSDDRIIPDAVRAVLSKTPLNIRNPGSIRPWQHVLDPLFGYIMLAAEISESEDPKWLSAWNFGPLTTDTIPVIQVVSRFFEVWGEGQYEQISNTFFPEANTLRLSSEKAMTLLKWRPLLNFDETIEMTAIWYRDFALNSKDMFEKSNEDVLKYLEKVKTKYAN